jgi:hypothetical protein
MEAMDDAAIRDLVIRLSRPHRSGGKVIERAAILAEGAAAAGVVDWILSRSGEPETAVAGRAGGLHGGRLAGEGRSSAAPLRYVLPAGALD